MKPGSVYIHHLSPPLNQLRSKDAWSRNVYIFIKYTDNDLALIYNLYQGIIERGNIQVFENYFVEVI